MPSCWCLQTSRSDCDSLGCWGAFAEHLCVGHANGHVGSRGVAAPGAPLAEGPTVVHPEDERDKGRRLGGRTRLVSSWMLSVIRAWLPSKRVGWLIRSRTHRLDSALQTAVPNKAPHGATLWLLFAEDVQVTAT